MKKINLFLPIAGAFVSGCAMFTSWVSIPPPGGCNQCHSAPISANWQVAYQSAAVADERGRQYFQTPEYNIALKTGQEPPPDTKKVEGQPCFECHKSPTPAHKERRGHFHHK